METPRQNSFYLSHPTQPLTKRFFDMNILGLDFGNVIRPAIPDGQHGSFDLPDNSYLDSPDFPEAKKCLLEAKRHFDEIHLISRSNDGRWDDRRKWLTHRGYDEIFELGKIHFCLNYKDKAPICRDIGVTHFVDDNLSRVLLHLSTVPNLFWFRRDMTLDIEHLPEIRVRKIRVALSWPRLLPQLLRGI